MPPFRYEAPVRFADVDRAGIVYYPVFFHYFHVAFEELFHQRLGSGAYAEFLEEERVGFPTVSARCDYRAPLAFGDVAAIEIALHRLGNTSVALAYRALRLRRGEDPVLSASGEVACAFIDLDTFQSVTPPERLRAMLLELS